VGDFETAAFIIGQVGFRSGLQVDGEVFAVATGKYWGEQGCAEAFSLVIGVYSKQGEIPVGLGGTAVFAFLEFPGNEKGPGFQEPEQMTGQHDSGQQISVGFAGRQPQGSAFEGIGGQDCAFLEYAMQEGAEESLTFLSPYGFIGKKPAMQVLVVKRQGKDLCKCRYVLLGGFTNGYVSH